MTSWENLICVNRDLILDSLPPDHLYMTNDFVQKDIDYSLRDTVTIKYRSIPGCDFFLPNGTGVLYMNTERQRQLKHEPCYWRTQLMILIQPPYTRAVILHEESPEIMVLVEMLRKLTTEALARPVKFIPVRNHTDAASYLIKQVLGKTLEESPPPPCPLAESKNRVLMLFPHLEPPQADALVVTFNNIKGIANAPVEKLRMVVPEAQAQAIFDFFNQEDEEGEYPDEGPEEPEDAME